jgi:hypothetical protein
MCGKDSAFSTFNPQDMDRDIYIRQTYGLGKRGFSYGPDESVLGDDFFTPKVMDRCIDLLNLSREMNILSSQELAARLKIGVPVQGTDTVVPYEDTLANFFEQNEFLRKRISSLENEVLAARRSGISIFEHEELKTRHNKLVNCARIKRKIDEILKYIHDNFNSRIILGEDDWLLEIYECTPEIYLYLHKKLYRLNREERNMLENRIQTKCTELRFLFMFMKGEPTIASVADLLIKKPSKVYYQLHNLPIPD